MWTYPTIDPVALQIGGIAIRWYALAYLAGIILGWRYSRWRLQALVNPPFPAVALDDFLMWATFGIIIGGRVGYAVFYQFDYYWYHPREVLYLWKGGMAFHGGFLGVAVATLLYCRKRRLPLWPFADALAIAAPIGIAFGRLANFINGELYGRVTTSSLGMVFPDGGPLPRHPSQLYEMLLEGVLLFIMLYLVSRRYPIGQRYGGLFVALFLGGYGLARFCVEFFREPDFHIGLIHGLSMGQWLSLPMIIAAFIVAYRVSRRHG